MSAQEVKITNDQSLGQPEMHESQGFISSMGYFRSDLGSKNAGDKKTIFSVKSDRSSIRI